MSIPLTLIVPAGGQTNHEEALSISDPEDSVQSLPDPNESFSPPPQPRKTAKRKAPAESDSSTESLVNRNSQASKQTTP